MGEPPPKESAGAPQPPDRAELLLAALLEEPPEDWERGLERLAAEHPAEAELLRRRFAALGELGLTGGPAAPPRSGLAGVPERLGDFRPLERIGEGGMGVVFRAEQVSLGREVALKLVRPELVLFRGSRERFRREVDAVARLKHPGIVPVYAVGEEGGLPFFAMELVEGVTLSAALSALRGRRPEELSGADLARVLRERHPALEPAGGPFELGWTEACVELTRQIAVALEHAHARGVVHRDVKPSNVALDADGRARLFDFGLTKSSGEERFTRTGSQPGTLAYMAPEQIEDRGTADARTDVYALGVTLYELLALTPPFRAVDPSETRERILAGDAPALRTRNRRVGRDLADVCATAMELDPGRRYECAALFARDLENVLAHRPILARPPGPLVRASRWLRRHPATAAGLLLVPLAAAVASGALYWQQRSYSARLERALDGEKSALARQSEALDDADGTLRVLLSLLHGAKPDGANGPEMTLRELLDHGARGIDQLDDRPRVKTRVQQAIGDAYGGLGEYARALPLLADVVRTDRGRGEPPSLVTLNAENSLASVLEAVGRLDEAEEHYRATLAGYQEIEVPEGSGAASLHNNLAGVLTKLGRSAEASEHYERAIAIYRAEGDQGSLGTALGNLSNVWYQAGDDVRAREYADRAVEAIRGSGDERGLSAALTAAGLPRLRRKDLAGAEPYLREAHELLVRVYGEHHDKVANAVFNLAALREAQGDPDGALELFEQALSVFEERGLGDLADETRGRIDRIVAKE